MVTLLSTPLKILALKIEFINDFGDLGDEYNKLLPVVCKDNKVVAMYLR